MLQFKIEVGSLRWKEVDKLEKADILFILEQSRKNKLDNRNSVDGSKVFEGTHENLYHFLFDLSYRYDIELV